MNRLRGWARRLNGEVTANFTIFECESQLAGKKVVIFLVLGTSAEIRRN
ncbi:hypothetical protein [Paenibacillus sp. Soil750]|nr:hypothetical protein [Paenibacillus sp. Soil750]